MPPLVKGQNAPLQPGPIVVTVDVTEASSLTALLVTDEGKVRTDDDVVFFNQSAAPGVELRDNALHIDPSLVPAEIQKIRVVTALEGNRPFGQLPPPMTRVVPVAGLERYEYPVDGLGLETVVVAAEVYRRNGSWKVRAVGQGYSGGLADLFRDHGITVDDEPDLTTDSAASPTAQPTGQSGPVNYSRPNRRTTPPPPPPNTGSIDYSRPSRPATTATPPQPANSGPVNYSRPDRHRNSSPAVGGSPAPRIVRPTAPPAPDIAPARPPAPSRAAAAVGARRVPDRIASRAESGSASAVKTTLMKNAELLDRDQSAIKSACRQQALSAATQIQQVLADAPNYAPTIQAIEQAARELEMAMNARFPGRYLPNGGSGTPPPPDVWLRDANTRIHELQTKARPLTKGGKERDWQLFSAQYGILSGHRPSVVRELYRLDFDYVKAALEDLSKQNLSRNIQYITQGAEFPGVFVPKDALNNQLDQVVPGIGPMRLSLGGRIIRERIAGLLRSGDRQEHTHVGTDAEIVAMAATIDLDRSGGFATTVSSAAESVILNGLAALDADQLTVRIFDPLKLGDSAAFIYGLDEYADRVIGEKVKTTDREIDELLQDTEEHITRVTQKYLQGEHQTLTSYNLASKMVAEPYRVLLLYGFPAGFVRQGHPEVDRLERLAKIIDGGPRAGVFTVIVSDDIEKLHRPSDAAPYIAGLPVFDSERFLGEKAVAALCGLEQSMCALQFSRLSTATGTQLEPMDSDAPKAPNSLDFFWHFYPLTHADELAADRAALIGRIKRTFAGSTGTVIRPGWVAGLSRDSNAAEPYTPSSWWRKSSQNRVNAEIGQLGASNVANLAFHSSDGGVGALVGGRPGSGKSVLMHALIMNMAISYAPTELQMYLIDFKEGVEFKCYADAALPHAIAVAIEAEREFGVSVLAGMADEIARRGELFRVAGVTKLDEYRRSTVEVMPRQIAIVDEFQKLFEKDDTLAQRAGHLIERILREGRAFGLHIVLASQSIQGLHGLDRHVLSLIPTRVALRMGAGDSELILGDSNVAAKDITRAGEGIVNTKQGNPDANERFQAALWHTSNEPGNGSDQSQVLNALRAKADAAGYTGRPRVFAGTDRAAITPEVLNVSGVPIGLPVSLDPPLARKLAREGGSNLLIVDESYGPLVSIILSFAKAGTTVRILDFMTGDDDWVEMAKALGAVPGVTVTSRRGVEDVLSEVDTIVSERNEFEEHASPSEIVVVAGLHRARDLDADDYEEESPANRLAKIAKDGPEVGIHVIAWSGRAAMVSRRLPRTALREFALRLVGPCSADESRELLDETTGSSLKPNQSIFQDHEHAFSARVLSYGAPQPSCIAELVR